MNGQSSTRRRRRVRSHAEQMYWDRLTPPERLAFTLGYAVGQGVNFPTPAQIGALRVQLGVDNPPVPTTSKTSKRRYTSRPIAHTADGRRFTYDLAKVAAIARTAIAAGESPARAVFEQIEQCASTNAAGVAIVKARPAGHDIPYVRGGTR